MTGQDRAWQDRAWQDSGKTGHDSTAQQCTVTASERTYSTVQYSTVTDLAMIVRSGIWASVHQCFPSGLSSLSLLSQVPLRKNKLVTWRDVTHASMHANNDKVSAWLCVYMWLCVCGCVWAFVWSKCSNKIKCSPSWSCQRLITAHEGNFPH